MLCLRTILHHSDLKDNARDIVKFKGLTLLMEIHEKYPLNRQISAIIAQILCNISLFPETKEDIFRSGKRLRSLIGEGSYISFKLRLSLN